MVETSMFYWDEQAIGNIWNQSLLPESFVRHPPILRLAIRSRSLTRVVVVVVDSLPLACLPCACLRDKPQP